VFRDSLELVRGPRRRGGGLKQNRETKVIHRARSWNEGENKRAPYPMEHPSFIDAVA
jgi:hypothetical protein